MDKILKDRKLLISSHLISSRDYDYIFVIDLQKASKMSFLTEILEVLEYKVKRRNYKGKEILEFFDEKSSSKIFLTLIENLLLGSFSQILIEDAIATQNIQEWEINQNFLKISNEISDRKLFNFYFNFAQLEKFFKIYSSEKSEINKILSTSLNYSVNNMDLENKQISLSGYTNLDTLPSIFRDINLVKKGKSTSFKVLPKETAIYISYCFDNFMDFYTKNKNDKSQIRKTELLFDIDLKKDFFSWFENEISISKVNPNNKDSDDIFVVIPSKNIKNAKRNLEEICSKIYNKNPFAFAKYEYKNYTIDFLNVKNFFSMFLGDLFKDLEKPYFTIIENFVIFSNSEEALKRNIDDFLNKNTMGNDKDFLSFKDNFFVKSNVNIFIKTSEMYEDLINYSPNYKRDSIEKNKKLIFSFSRIGVQFVSDEEIVKTKMIVKYDENPLMIKNNRNEEHLFINEYENLNFKIKINDSLLNKKGTIITFNHDTTLQYEGKLKNKLLDGIWKVYYLNGNFKSDLSYKDGKLDGKSIFYFDNKNNTKKAEVNFKDDKIEGIYKDFFENKARKSVLFYKNNKLDGESQIFYKNGTLKEKGNYKDGFKNGDWNFFSENGESKGKKIF